MTVCPVVLGHCLPLQSLVVVRPMTRTVSLPTGPSMFMACSMLGSTACVYNFWVCVGSVMPDVSGVSSRRCIRV